MTMISFFHQNVNRIFLLNFQENGGIIVVVILEVIANEGYCKNQNGL